MSEFQAGLLGSAITIGLIWIAVWLLNLRDSLRRRTCCVCTAEFRWWSNDGSRHEAVCSADCMRDLLRRALG